MTRKPRLRCAIYTRKSSEEGLEQSFNSLQAQREACEAYIKSQAHEGWIALPTIYDDGGFSGGSMERPALQKLLADLASGRIDVVVVYKVDRLTRSLADFAKIVEIFDARGASFVSVTQQFNTTSSMGRLTLNVLLSFAQFEREVTGERIRDKIAASRRKGMWMGGMPPLGYDVKDRKLAVNDAEAAVVRHIFQRYVELSCVAALAEQLRRDGIGSKRWTTQDGKVRGGGPFGRGALYHLLKNRVYLGLAVHKGEAWPGNHDAIVSQELWDRVQTRLAENRHQANKLANATILAQPLTGLLFDDRGYAMSPSHAQKKNGVRYRYYVSQALLGGTPDDAGSIARVAAATIEGIVEHQMIALMPERDRQRWPQLPLEDRLVRLRELVRRVTVRNDAVEIGVDATALDAASPNGRSTVERPDYNPTATRILSVPIRIRTRGGSKLIEMQDGRNSRLATRPDRALIKALVRAHHWLDKLDANQANSTFELADQEGCHVRYVRNVLKLAFLAPDITEAILDGRQPAHLTLADLVRAELPASWSAQRTLLGFSPRF